MAAKAKKGGRGITLERLMTIAVGALNMTRDNAQKIVKEWEKEGEISRKDAKKYVDDLVKKGQKERDEIRKTVDERVDSLTSRIGIVTKADLSRLNQKLDRLERKLK